MEFTSNTLKRVIFILLAIQSFSAKGQWQDHLYGNEWIDYGKKYLRIEITKTGIQSLKVSDLPSEYQQIDPSSFQLWHRGKEIPLVKATSGEIQFYGIINDGASDSLVHRPKSSRVNPYVSLYSEKGVYFLTSSTSPKRVNTTDGRQPTGDAEPFHIEKQVVTYSNIFSFSTQSPGAVVNNSFYNSTNSWTGKRIAGLGAYSTIALDTVLNVDIKLDNWLRTDSFKPRIELLLTGLNTGTHNIYTLLSPDNSSFRTFGNFTFSGWGSLKNSFILNNSDFSDSGNASLKCVSNTSDRLDWYSLAYYTIEYPQLTDMFGSSSKVFTFPPATNTNRNRIIISGVPENPEIFDISDPENPVKIEGILTGSTLEFTAQRKQDIPLKIQIVSTQEYHVVAKENIHSVNLSPIYTYDQKSATTVAPVDPARFDYIIITASKLAEGSKEYADYRMSAEGGNHKVLVMNIRDLYDLHNYGEPSPIGIRSFMKYMLKDHETSSNKRNLFLIGATSSYPTNLLKELVDEVPTFGDPGSDNLLVCGLAGAHEDVPAVPVGRLKVFNNDEIRGYLDKVKSYENERYDISWRKNVLHLSGGQNASEVNSLKSILSGLVPILETGPFSGSVTAKAKNISSPTVERINISEYINEGVGLLTFFGHGSQTVTDLDIGYASDAARGYANKNKYPVMYFNGCGVGNIFTSRSNHILSDNWLVTPDKGAIAILANSYNSYVSSSAKHLQVLYETYFSGDNILAIGEIVQEVCQKIVESNPNIYDIANIHQVCLQGDPVLKLIKTGVPDYIVSNDQNAIFLKSLNPNQSFSQSEQADLGIVISNGGIYLNKDKIDIKVTIEYANAQTIIRENTISDIRRQDTLWFRVDNLENLLRIEVDIDPDQKLEEFSKTNNIADLTFEWEDLKNLNFYPLEPVKDRIAPRFKILFDNREIPNKSSVTEGSQIAFVIEDDRVLDLSVASSLEVYIRSCWDSECEAVPLELNPDWAYTTNSREVVVQYSGTPLPPGEYELFLTGSDKAGNRPVESGVSIYFRIEENQSENSGFRVTVSPNPSTSGFARFSLENSPASAKSISVHIFNMRGELIKKENLLSPVNATDSRKNWYWDTTRSIQSGVYLYKVIAEFENNVVEQAMGKIIIQN